MFSSKALQRVKVIQKKINFIEAIVKENGSVTQALEDVINERLAVVKKSAEKVLSL